MKKLITGAVAAIAILLGFAACSGDLHENEVAPLYIEGVTSARVPMTKVSDTEQIYKFIYSKNLGGWHNTSASIEFKTMVDGGSDWSRDWGAPKDETVVLKVGDEEYTPLLNREADGVGGAGPGNIEVYDLVEGQEYTIRMQVDIATLSGKIRIEGLSVAAPDMEIIASTDANGKDAAKIPMTRGGTTYTYEFIAAKTVDLYFYFYCSALNTTYTVVEDSLGKYKLDPVKDSIQDAHGNNLNANGTVVTDDSYVLDVWKKARKVSILKNHKYSIKIEANDLAIGYTGTISYEEEMDDGKDGILKNAVLIGQWKYANNHDGDYAIKPTDKFVASDSTVEFKVLRYSDSDEMAFGSAVELKPGTDYAAYGAEKEVEYFTTQVIDDNKFSYKSAEKDMNALEKVKYIKVTGLTKGHTYGFKFEPANIENGKMKVSVAEFKELTLTEKIQGSVFKGGFNSGWSPVYTCKDFNDGVLEIKGLVNEKGGNEFECGIFEDVDESTYMFRNATIEWKDTDGEDYGTAVEFTEDAGDGKNAKIKGLAPNAKFDIKITTKEGKVYVAVKVAKDTDTRSNLEKFAANAKLKGEISFNNELPYAKKTEAADKKSVTLEYGPFRKADKGKWILTDGSVYYGSCKLGYVDLTGEKGTEVTLVADTSDDKKNEITDVTFTDDFYYIVIRATTDKDGKIDAVYAKIKPTKDSELPFVPFAKVYVAGSAPLTWGLGNEDAMTVSIVAEKAECKNYYYTFTAAATSLDFKVALENGWNDAYSNCQNADGEAKTILDAAPVEFEYANAKNACIEGLTVGEKYTMVIDTSSGKPKVSIVSGADVLFAIGNDDFGKWSWDTPIMMTPVDKGEWKYEFTATNAAAEFKFQTTCGGWHDEDTWNAQKEISVGDDYTEMKYQVGGGANTSATLTVGTKYVLSVKSINGKYNVKIATAE